MTIDTQYKKCVEFLDENYAFFLTHILNIGKPKMEPGIGTAAIMFSLGTRDSLFTFVFDPDFFESLDTVERSFVLAHETIHVLLNHPALYKQGIHTTFTDVEKFNKAADCVINDYLVGMGFDAKSLRQNGCFGEDVVGYNCANSMVSDVYLDIPDSPTASFDNHDWITNPSTADIDQVIDAVTRGTLPQDLEDKKTEVDSASYGNLAGSGLGGWQSWKEETGVTLAWMELLKKIDPDIIQEDGPKPRPSYSQPRRKLGGVNAMRRAMGDRPITLPITREVDHPDGEKPRIFMALDVSGSCSSYANSFVTLARSIPSDRVSLHAATFSTSCHKLDLEKPRWRGGGTSFNCVEKYIQSNVVPEFGEYPKTVIMVTDGYASRPNIATENQNKWVWLRIGGGGPRWNLGTWYNYHDFATHS